MICFIATEAAFFCTLIVVYLIYLGASQPPLTPRDVLALGPLVIVSSICLFSSSGTVHFAEKSMHEGNVGGFARWWLATIVLGALFIGGTAIEWHEMIYHHHLTISTNLFGSTYYTLVGFHAFHVTVGLLLMTILLGLVWGGGITAGHPLSIQLVSWYWHFVDVVWVVVFTVVYIIGR
jgi:cytochrome c oxidase subunit 3/cytochrome o ubiquinol oxidase subunit 3